MAILLILGVAGIFAQDDSTHREPLTRRYHEGERLTYRMKASNGNRRFEIQATGS